MAGFMIALDVGCTCLTCGRARPEPAPSDVDRSVTAPDEPKTVYLKLFTKCPQCGGQTVAVRLHTDISGEG